MSQTFSPEVNEASPFLTANDSLREALTQVGSFDANGLWITTTHETLENGQPGENTGWQIMLDCKTAMVNLNGSLSGFWGNGVSSENHSQHAREFVSEVLQKLGVVTESQERADATFGSVNELVELSVPFAIS